MTIDEACRLKRESTGDHWMVHPNNEDILISSNKFWTLSPKGRQKFWSHHEKLFSCKKCGKNFGVIKKDNGQVNLRDSVCQHCGANVLGKVYPQKRTEERVIKECIVEDNMELDSVLNKLIGDNQKIVEDFRSNEKAIGRLVDLSKKLFSEVDGKELQLRLIRLIKSHG
jgi:DNA-directed RNA polymerase subunit RPC12/RpoP